MGSLVKGRCGLTRVTNMAKSEIGRFVVGDRSATRPQIKILVFFDVTNNTAKTLLVGFQDRVSSRYGRKVGNTFRSSCVRHRPIPPPPISQIRHLPRLATPASATSSSTPPPSTTLRTLSPPQRHPTEALRRGRGGRGGGARPGGAARSGRGIGHFWPQLRSFSANRVYHSKRPSS